MLTLLPLFFPLLHSFNIDTQSVYVLKAAGESAFGYSVALHKGSSVNYLLVGAPSAQTQQDGVTTGGAVFKCELGAEIGDPPDTVECNEQITFFDDTGDLYYNPTTKDERYEALGGYYPKENKTSQWMGVDVSSSDDYVVACAHRYENKYYGTNLYDDPPRQIIGKCVTVSQDLDEQVATFKPCEGRDSGYTKYGSCQAGTSIALQHDDLLIGAPGKYEWSGGAFLFSPSDPMAVYGIETLELKNLDNVDVFEPATGHSATICDMNGDGQSDYIFGGPRGNLYKGEVFIFNKNDDEKLELVGDYHFPLWHDLQGDQIGSYYGHSLACGDFNGDGFDDLVIGAPWYTDYSEGGIPADTGRVYIYTANHDFLPEELNVLELDGEEAGAAFGFALELAGDTNKDGYMDLFIGSPFANDGEGAVFLYLGSYSGIHSAYTQRITPSNLNILDNIQRFGWSLSGGKDMDGNGYPDVLVGSYKSGHSVFLRTMKIMDVTPSLKFTKDTIEPKENDVTVPGSELQVPGTYLMVCFAYTGEASEEGSAKIQYKVNLDTDKNEFSARLYFNYTNPSRSYQSNMVLNLADQTLHCTSKIPVYYKASTLDVRPVMVDIEADLAEVGTFKERAVLNQETIKDTTGRISIASKCPADTGVCLVDNKLEFLQVEFKESSLYDDVVIDYVPRVTVPVRVTNTGPHYSYGTVLNISLPQQLVYAGIKDGAQGVKCEAVGTEDVLADNYLICRLPDPIEPGLILLFRVEFSLRDIKEPTSLMISGGLLVGRPSEEQEDADNTASLSIPVRKLAELAIRGGATQRKLPFNNKYTIVDVYTESRGPSVHHNYEVTLEEDAINEGVDNITINIYWPHKFPNQAWLLPLISLTTPPDFNDSSYCTYPNQTEEDSYWFPPEPDVNIGSVSCVENRTNCLKISCNIERIRRGSAFYGNLAGFKIRLLARVHERSMYGFEGLNITSLAEIESIEEGLLLPKLRSATAQTELYASKSKSRNLIWIIIGSALAGLLLLLIMTLLLCKYSTFFKRNKAMFANRTSFKKIETHVAEKSEALF